MIDIKYIKADATNPIGDGRKIIIHVCNDIGAWGSGFVMAISRRWKEPEVQYKKWSRGHIKGLQFDLGVVQFVKVADDIVIGNMIGQHGIGKKNNVAPIRYPAIAKCLQKVAMASKKNDATIHAPRFGAGLAGGDWSVIEALIIKIICSEDIPVTIYDI